MENSNSSEILTIQPIKHDYSLSSLFGLSIGVVTTIFTITLFGLQVAGIHFMELLRGDFHLHGDPSILYMGIFLISATMLLVVQHHFQINQEDS